MHIGRPLSAESYNDNFNFGTTQELSIGNTLTEIPDGAFANCKELKELTLGGGLERIGANAFSGCGLTEVVIPPSVSSIGEMAFADNADLKEVKIGHGITEIGEKAFDGCNNLANIYIAAQTPPSAPNNTFSSFNAPLWLTDEDSFEAYSNSPVCWHSFEDNLLAMKPVEALTTDNPLIEGNPGDKLHLTVNVEPADATLPHIFWTSSDPSVATVDNEGNVTFTAEAAAAVAGQDDTEEEMLYDTVRSCVIRAQSMYAGVPVLELNVNKSIPEEDPAVEIQTVEADTDAPMEIYTLRGIRVGSDLNALPHGIYIIRQGAKTTKRAI